MDLTKRRKSRGELRQRDNQSHPAGCSALENGREKTEQGGTKVVRTIEAVAHTGYAWACSPRASFLVSLFTVDRSVLLLIVGVAVRVAVLHKGNDGVRLPVLTRLDSVGEFDFHARNPADPCFRQ